MEPCKHCFKSKLHVRLALAFLRKLISGLRLYSEAWSVNVRDRSVSLPDNQASSYALSSRPCHLSRSAVMAGGLVRLAWIVRCASLGHRSGAGSNFADRAQFRGTRGAEW